MARSAPVHLVSDARLQEAQQLTSELVADAIRHGGCTTEPISVIVFATPRVLHVQVRDHGRDLVREQLDTLRADRVGRSGLQIITAFADRCGVERASATTWFEIDRPQLQRERFA